MLNAKAVFCVTGLAIAGTAVIPAQSIGERDNAVKLRPYVTWFGSDSAIDKPSYFQVTSPKQWLDIWERHTGKQARRDNVQRPFVPTIDFESCTVIAIFTGRRWNCSGLELQSIRDEAGHIRLRFDQRTYQTDASASGDRVKPFGIFVLPKLTKPVRIEENVQGLKGRPPKSKHRATVD